MDDGAWAVRIANNPASAPLEYWVALFGPEAGTRLYTEIRLAAMMAAAGPR